MCNGNHKPGCAETRGMLSSLAMQMQNRLSADLILDFDVAPAHATSPTCAESLHGSFFRGESRGVTLKFALVPLAILNFRRREHTLKERAPVTRHRFLQAINFCNVYAQADDQFVLALRRDSSSWRQARRSEIRFARALYL